METNKLQNYFKLLDEEKLKSYTNLLYVQLAHCLFIGSADTENPGKQWIEDKDGISREIIRPDHKSAFVNSVNMLQFLMEGKMPSSEKTNLTENPDYEAAKANLRMLLKHIHKKTPLFGAKSMTVIMEGKNAAYNLK